MKANGKRKKNNTPQQQIPADLLIEAVQLYSNMAENAVQNRRRRGKVKYKAEGLLSEIIEQFQGRNKAIDVHYLFHRLHYLFAWKTFYDISEGNAVIQELQALNIEVPELVQDCLQEIEMRNRLVKEYATEKYQWSEEKIQNWKDEIESKLLAFSYDNSSRKHYLAGLFSDAVSEIKKLESEALAKYGYYIDGFYSADTFVATENDLNNLFFHGESVAGGYTAFRNIFLLLIKYIDKHNEVALLKNLINNQKQFEKDKIPYTHREIMIAHEYKRKAGIEKHKTANDWKKERGNGCYNDYYTLQPKTKNIKYPYKEPTAKELGKVIELLEGYPQLQEQVRRRLESL